MFVVWWPSKSEVKLAIILKEFEEIEMEAPEWVESMDLMEVEWEVTKCEGEEIVLGCNAQFWWGILQG